MSKILTIFSRVISRFLHWLLSETEEKVQPKPKPDIGQPNQKTTTVVNNGTIIININK